MQCLELSTHKPVIQSSCDMMLYCEPVVLCGWSLLSSSNISKNVTSIDIVNSF